jgi:hypothetical protein
MQCYWEWEIPRNWNEKKKKQIDHISTSASNINIYGTKDGTN